MSIGCIFFSICPSHFHSINRILLQEIATNMQLLIILLPLFFSIAFGSPSDILYIQKLSADEAQALDNKDFAALRNIFSKNAVYNPGLPSPNVYGIDDIQAKLATFFPPTVISQNTASTESINLLPPFDEQGAAGTATGVVYTSASYLGQGDTAGQGLFIFAKYNDMYVKTGDFARYGGWRISQRFIVPFVSLSESRSTRDPELSGGS